MVIETERLMLQPFQASFITENYVGWLSDPEVVQFSEQRHTKHTKASCQAYLESFDGTSNYFFAIFTRSDQEHIGNINAYVDEQNQVADVGIMIGERSAWGKGYGAEAWRALCEFLFAQGIRKITAGTMAANKGMLKIMEKTGMQEDGRRKAQFLLDGEPVDLVYAALFNKEGLV